MTADRSLYDGMDFAPHDLKSNDSRVFVTDAIAMVERALDLAGKDGLSFMLARELRVTIHGTLGFTALTSPTLAGALDSVRRYLQLTSPEPAYYRKFAPQLPVPFEYGQPEETMVFPKGLLDTRMRLSVGFFTLFSLYFRTMP